ncbi:MAG: hypothetical protein DDT37_01838 [Firmicutes bacterium]|nr:hypothetical protein [candidate division NPL-UPA2 bacterium]
MDTKTVTSLDIIQSQAAPEVITIPGFRPGTVINVRIKYVDLTTAILETNISNPLLALAYQQAREGKSRQEIEDEVNRQSDTPAADAERVLASLSTLAQQALVEPTYEQLTAIAPLNAEQLAAVYLYMLYGERGDGLSPFRDKSGVREADKRSDILPKEAI